jgi:hypothetical protein
MTAASDAVVVVIVTSARGGEAPRGERPPVAVAHHQVVPVVEPEVPAGGLVVVGGEVDGLDDGKQQVLGVQRLARPRHARTSLVLASQLPAAELAPAC